MRTKIILTSNDKTLIGKYSQNADNIYCLIDTTFEDITIDLPDCRNGNNFEFIFKNIGNNSARIQPATGQYIDTSLYYDISAWDELTLWSDLQMRWIIVNRNSVMILR